ncbi:MAG TPA: hypothetical protein VGD78_16250 [Chthoniobacterales bacterium]
MHLGEAVVLSASRRLDGVQEVEFDAVCPEAGCERLNVVAGEWRVAVALNQPARGALYRFKAVMATGFSPRPGEKVLIEFFHPGEQAGVH